MRNKTIIYFHHYIDIFKMSKHNIDTKPTNLYQTISHWLTTSGIKIRFMTRKIYLFIIYFSESTSIHGVVYMMNRGLHLVERWVFHHNIYIILSKAHILYWDILQWVFRRGFFFLQIVFRIIIICYKYTLVVMEIECNQNILN